MIDPSWSRRIARISSGTTINDLSYKSKYSFIYRIGREKSFSDLSKSDQTKFLEYEKEIK